MRVHAVQTGSVRVKATQIRGHGSYLERTLANLRSPDWVEVPIQAYVVEHPEGLIVVDTGETGRTAEPGYFPGWHPYYRWAVVMRVTPDEEVGPAIKRLGLSLADARWVVLTHLHTDHAGGLHHFPHAEILVSRAEHRRATGLAGRVVGYLPDRWPDWFTPRLVDFSARAIGPLTATLDLTKSGDVHLVSTPGHTPGHMSVVVEADDRTYFLAGDASYDLDAMRDGVVDGVAPNAHQYLRSLGQIREFVDESDAVYLPCHDAGVADRLTAVASTSRPDRFK
jgi:glyoxylase-like metal-dependent hydrolase (beta-lactamase superfamily II)